MTLELLLTAALPGATAADPVTSDPVVDPAHPPRMASLKLPSGGAQLNALFYLAGGPGPHPVVVVLHGYPGNEKNLDLAQAIRRAGYHVLWFNYRGSWGSGGAFSFAHALADVRSAVAFARSPEAAQKYGCDPRRIALVGHSFGGWLAFMTAAEDPGIAAVAGLAAWNAPVDIARTENDPKKRAAKIADLEEFEADSGPLRGPGAAAIYAEVAARRVEYDYFRKAPQLKTRPVLVIAATRDLDQPLPEYHEPWVQALRTARAEKLEVVVYEDDHPFSAHRIALAGKVTEWLGTALPRR